MLGELGEVFVSYTHDSPEHVRRVLELANRLRGEGVDAIVDQYESSPPEGWPMWMDRKIRDAQYVLMICTAPYNRRVMGEEEEGIGLGIRWEGRLIYQHLYDAGSESQKFIPVLFDGEAESSIPTPVRGATRYVLEGEYDDLYFRLTNQEPNEKPDLGKLRPLPEKGIQTDIATFLSLPINVKLWDEAKWLATVYAVYESVPPVLGIGFENEDAAREIFREWRERFGDRDEYEELRISIIEGDIPGLEPGYSVHLGPNLQNMITRAKEKGLYTFDDLIRFITITRINRMHPQPDSQSLEKFKEAFRKEKSYNLTPVILGATPEQSKPIFDLRILKGEIFFRRSDEIPEGDIDSLVLNRQ